MGLVRFILWCYRMLVFRLTGKLKYRRCSVHTNRKFWGCRHCKGTFWAKPLGNEYISSYGDGSLSDLSRILYGKPPAFPRRPPL